jgi:hypothetical protein
MLNPVLSLKRNEVYFVIVSHFIHISERYTEQQFCLYFCNDSSSLRCYIVRTTVEQVGLLFRIWSDPLSIPESRLPDIYDVSFSYFPPSLRTPVSLKIPREPSLCHCLCGLSPNTEKSSVEDRHSTTFPREFKSPCCSCHCAVISRNLSEPTDTVLQETEKSWQILGEQLTMLRFYLKYKGKKFCCGHNILTEGVFVSQQSGDTDISVWRIVWAATNCCFMGDMKCNVSVIHEH